MSAISGQRPGLASSVTHVLTRFHTLPFANTKRRSDKQRKPAILKLEGYGKVSTLRHTALTAETFIDDLITFK
jgi:hypothetical protein